jgi:D-alanyl-D-alanine carboxypeptidase
MKKYENTLIFSLIVLAIFCYYGMIQEKNFQQKAQKEELREALLVEELNKTPFEAKAISVFDSTKNKKLYGKNESVLMPFASLGKTMTVLTTLSKINREDYKIISPESSKQEGGGILSVGDRWEVQSLARYTILSSSNEGAYTLLEPKPNFLKSMNEKAHKIGMKNTNFYNSTGLDIDLHNPGSYGTAEDANTMSLYAVLAYPDIFNVTTKKEAEFISESGKKYLVFNRNTSLEKIPNIIFSKTGFTKLAGGNLSVIFKDRRNHFIAVTVLGSSIDGRFKDVEKIVNILYNFNYEI